MNEGMFGSHPDPTLRINRGKVPVYPTLLFHITVPHGGGPSLQGGLYGKPLAQSYDFGRHGPLGTHPGMKRE